MPYHSDHEISCIITTDLLHTIFIFFSLLYQMIAARCNALPDYSMFLLQMRRHENEALPLLT